MRKILILGAMVAASTAGTAFAQDTTPSENGTSFRGIRVEGQVGGDRFQSQGKHEDNVGYGGAVGFDGIIGDRIVVGAEGTLWDGGRGENCTTVRGGALCQKSFQEYGVAVRAGLLVTPQLLVYGKGGYVNNEQRKSFTGNVGTGVTGEGQYYDHFNTGGYQVGGGVEYSLNENFYVNGEYKFSRYNDNTSRQRALVGVGFRFK